MADRSDKRSATRVEIFLDGVPVEFSGPNRVSVAMVCCYLDMLALQRNRVLSSVSVNGTNIDLTEYEPAILRRGRIIATTTGVDEVATRATAAARHELAWVMTHIPEATLLMVINEAGVAQQLWWQLVPVLRRMLLNTALASELSSRRNRAERNRAVAAHGRELANVIGEVQSVAATGDTLALSDVIEERVRQWLEETDRILVSNA